MKNQNNKNKKKNMNNKQGFTLIELLAVIVILAILMITAIPAVTSSIAKSRRDTYATNSKKIIDAVRTSMLNEEFLEGTSSCQLPGVNDYVTIDLASKTNNHTVIENLLERGGTNSSFNKPYDAGTIYIVNEGTLASGTSTGTDKYVYYITLTDSGKNGISAATAENELTRNKIFIGSAVVSTTKPATATGTAHVCTYNG